MKLLEVSHARNNYWPHFKRAGKISGFFFLGAIAGVIHTVMPWLIPDAMTAISKKIAKSLDINLCECPEEEE